MVMAAGGELGIAVVIIVTAVCAGNDGEYITRPSKVLSFICARNLCDSHFTAGIKHVRVFGTTA